MQHLCDEAELCGDAQLALNQLVWLSNVAHPREHGRPPRGFSPAGACTQISLKITPPTLSTAKTFAVNFVPMGRTSTG